MGPSGTFTFDPTFAAQDVAAGSISRGTGTGGYSLPFLRQSAYQLCPAARRLTHFDDQTISEVSLSTNVRRVRLHQPERRYGQRRG